MAVYTPLQVPTYQLRGIVPKGWVPADHESQGAYTRLQSFRLALVHFSAHADHPGGRPEALVIGQVYEEHFIAARIVFGPSSTFTVSYKLGDSLEAAERWLDAQCGMNRFGRPQIPEQAGPEPPAPDRPGPSARAQAARSTTTDGATAAGPAPLSAPGLRTSTNARCKR